MVEYKQTSGLGFEHRLEAPVSPAATSSEAATAADLGSVFLFWPPQRVRETAPLDFGVTPPAGSEGDLNPYVPRAVDAELDAALDRGPGLVLVIAESGSGAKRTLYEALLRRRPDSPLLIPRQPLPEDPETLYPPDVAEYPDPVLWVADAAPLSRAPAVDLLVRPPYDSLTVVGLVRPETAGQLRASGLDHIAVSVAVPRQLNVAERLEAQRLYPLADVPEELSAGELGDLAAAEDGPQDRGPTPAAERSRVRVDHVYTLPDAPAPVDLLGRKPLAESLAIRFRTMRAETDPATSFLLHIDGPWGAGKSSLLNYLRDELRSDSLVVDFNAWREQRVGPPWLGLLMALRRSAFARYGRALRARELLSRLRTVGLGFLALIVVTVGITAAAVLWAAAGDLTVIGLGDAARSLAAVIAFGASVWTITTGLSRGLLPGSPRQARRYVEGHADPMERVAEHFDGFLRLVEHPVVIFIDDLDRCAEGYVVEFLEAVQTILRDRPGGGRRRRRNAEASLQAPYFVVAADGRWIRASYERAYAAFADEVTYPGRPLGYLFLEKAFQLTTSLPAIDPERRQEYLDYLLRIGDAADTLVEHEADLRRADEVLEDARTEEEILERVADHGGDGVAFRHALRGEAVKRMARPDVAERLEHALRDYADLLEANPRAMKRFVNAYGVERALRTIEQRRPSLDRLARWTILMLRWPELADVLRADPAAVELVGTPVRGAVADTVRALFTDPDVVRVVKGTDPQDGAPLDAAAIRECAGLPPA